MLRMKNTRTGEVRDVERNTPEHAALAKTDYDDGKGGTTSAWEEVGDFDLFTEYEEVARRDPVEMAGVHFETHPERNLTEAEIEAGLTWEDKVKSMGVDPGPTPPLTRKVPRAAPRARQHKQQQEESKKPDPAVTPTKEAPSGEEQPVQGSS